MKNAVRDERNSRLLLGALFLLFFSTAAAAQKSRAQSEIDSGDSYLLTRDYAKAVQYYSEAIELDPRSVEAYFKRAWTYLGWEGKADYGKALADASKALDLDPAYKLARFARGKAYLGKARAAKEAKNLKEAEVLFDKAQTELTLAQGADFRAVKLFPNYLFFHKNPPHLELLVDLGHASFGKGDLDRALAAFSSAYETDPPSSLNVDWALRDVFETFRLQKRDFDVGNAPRTLILLGDSYRQNSPNLAIRCFTRALDLASDKGLTYHAYIGRSVAHANKGDFASAIADADNAINIYDFVSSYVNRAEIYEKQGDLNKAVRDYTEAIRTERSSQKERDVAIDRFGVQGLTKLYEKRAWIHFDNGSYDKALADFRTIEKEPNLKGSYKALLYSIIARLYERKGDKNNADKYHKKAQAMDPQGKAGAEEAKTKKAPPGKTGATAPVHDRSAPAPKPKPKGEELAFESSFMDRNGRIISDRGFDDVRWFKNDLAAVKSGGTWGYLGKTGRIVVEPVFEEVPAEFPAAGPARVKKGGKYGYIDRTGAFAIEPRFDSAHDFAEGLAAVKDGTRWGFIDTKGQIAFYVDGYAGKDAATGSELTQTILDLLPFKEGAARAEIKLVVRNAATGKVNNLYGYSFVTRDGMFHMLADATDFCRGTAVVRSLEDTTGTTYHIVRKNEFLARGAVLSGKTVQLKGAYESTDGKGYYVVKRPSDGLENLMDWEGNFVSKEWFLSAMLFSEGLASVTRRLPNFDEERGYIDSSGNPAIPLRPDIENQSDFRGGLAANKKGGKWGYIDKAGRWAIEPRFAEAGGFSEGLAPVQLGSGNEGGKRWVLIDKSGQEVVSFPQGYFPIMTRSGHIFSEGWMPVARGVSKSDR
jgi:tetratricopeptide (TPR) repeat protein